MSIKTTSSDAPSTLQPFLRLYGTCSFYHHLRRRSHTGHQDAQHRQRPPRLRRPPRCNGTNKKMCSAGVEQNNGARRGKSIWKEERLYNKTTLRTSYSEGAKTPAGTTTEIASKKRGRIHPCALLAAAQCIPCIVGCESRHSVTHEAPPLRRQPILGPKIHSKATLT